MKRGRSSWVEPADEQVFRLGDRIREFIKRREAGQPVRETTGTYEDGIADTLAWLMTGKDEPCRDINQQGVRP